MQTADQQQEEEEEVFMNDDGFVLLVEADSRAVSMTFPHTSTTSSAAAADAEMHPMWREQVAFGRMDGWTDGLMVGGGMR